MQKSYIDELNQDYSKAVAECQDTKLLAMNRKIIFSSHSFNIENTSRPYSHTSLGYNPPGKFVSKKEAQKDMMMHSFDNILAPLDLKSMSDQASQFSSTKTFDKVGPVGATTTKFDANRTLER